MTQAELGRRAGRDPATVLAIERGDSEPNWGTVRSIAAGLGVPLKQLVADADRRLEDNIGTDPRAPSANSR